MKKRCISFLLFILLFANLFSGISVNASSPVTTIVACSDFQNETSFADGKIVVDDLLDVIKNDGITSADGFFCCGDYDYGYNNSKQGIETLKTSIDGFVTGESVFVQGNHDNLTIGTNGLSVSGNNDPESGAYGVFVIHEDDYMWYNSDEQRIKQTAQNLLEYLNEKLETGYDKPIFVLSHLALNYNMRTYNDGDGKYAKYIFDVLNSAGEKGLNIVFMFGHNHSNGWDDYLGGSSVYLKKGDSINIANYSKTEFDTYTLNFTYMNAGYIGYYRNVNGADDTLSMTVISITDDDFSVSRYSRDGKHLLKSSGVTNSYKNEKNYPPDLTEYTSPQKISLTQVTDSTPIPDIIKKRTVGAKYQLVTDISQLKNGGKYLFLYKGSLDYVMKPIVVTKPNSGSNTRTGYDIEATSDFISTTCVSDYTDSLWTFTLKNNEWYIGCDKGNMIFSGTSVQSAVASFSANGSPITIAKTNDKFTFFDGAYYLNYNSRGLINGYNSNPAEFYLYEYLGNTITVSGGKASKNCAFSGEQVTVSLSETDNCFDGWNVSQNVEFDLTQKEITFIMPDYPLEFMALYNSSHAWSEWVYNDGATEESRTCSLCGDKQTNILSDDSTYRPDDNMPFVALNDDGNAVMLDHNKSWATRVYWGNIGEEFVDYKWFDEDFRLLCGTDYFADCSPQPGETYNFTKPGWYRFVVKGIRTGTTVEDYTYSELLFDFYYDGSVAPTVPTITELGNNQVKINTNGAPVKKFYFGNIGDKNVPYSWFNSFWGTALLTKTYTPVFDGRDGRIITLQTKGYYNIVIVLDDGTEYVYTTYADENAPIIESIDNKAVVDIDILKGNVDTAATISKLYYGYVGTEDKTLNSYDEIKTNTTGFSAVSAVQGTTINLKNKGYYKFLAVVILSNGRTVEIVCTVENS